MSSTFKMQYGTTNQGITITLNSLASSSTSGRQSAAVDNRTNLYLDALVAMQLTIPAGGTIGNDKCIYVKVFGTADDTNYGAERQTAGIQQTLVATDAGYSETDPTVGPSPLILARTIVVPVAPTTTDGVYVIPPFSVANLFGGVLPAQWGIFVRNYTNIGLKASGNSAWYQGIYQQGT